MSYWHQFDPQGEDYKRGASAEEQFLQLFKAKYTGEIRKSSLEEDWKHADYVIGAGNKIRCVDVKAAKFVAGKYAVWLEVIGHGRLGWIYGKQDYVAFQKPDFSGFVVVSVWALQQYVKKNIVAEVVTRANDAWGRMYMREKSDRSCDVVALTTWDELLKMKEWEL